MKRPTKAKVDEAIQWGRAAAQGTWPLIDHHAMTSTDPMKQLATLSLEVEHLRLDVTTLRSVLDRIANTPIGHAEASHAEVLDAIVTLARAALSRVGGGA